MTARTCHDAKYDSHLKIDSFFPVVAAVADAHALETSNDEEVDVGYAAVRWKPKL